MSTEYGIYKVQYSGFWLGGKAIAIAPSWQKARSMVEQHCDTVGFVEVRTKKIADLAGKQTPIVVYNDNGDY